MALILAAPPAPPPPVPGPQWTGVTSMTWQVPGLGTLDLLDPSVDGLMLLREGVRGLNMPPVDRFTSQSPAVPGSRWRGWQAKERNVFWPMLVWTREGSTEWQAIDASLWSLLRPDLLGYWEVITDNTGPRRLACRWTGDSDHAYDRDPLRYGWTVYGVELVAENPFWEGDAVSATWGTPTGQATFLPGPPFWIGGAATVDTADLENPGDLPAYIEWTVTGPAKTATVGFRDDTDSWAPRESKVEVPFEVPDGCDLVIDTRPHKQTAILYDEWGNGTDRTADLGEVAFAPIPAGNGATLTLALEPLTAGADAGTITADLTPLYYRALS